MDGNELKKALLDIAKAIDGNEAVKKVIVKIEIEKPKPSKANPKSK